MSAYIVGYSRTPFAKFTGKLSSVPAPELGGHAARAALRAAGVAPEAVDQVIFGQVLQAGGGQNPARQTAVAAKIPLRTPALTINAVCLSGMEAVTAAVRLVRADEADIVVAGGQESMSLAPHVLYARSGQRFGPLPMLDTIEHDGLTDAFENCSMGASTESGNVDLGIGRTAQDEYAATSHQRATDAADFHRAEITPLTVSSRRGDVLVDSDDGVRSDTTATALSTLRPVFAKSGTITVEE